MGPRNGDFEAESLKKKTKTENIKKKTRNDTYGAKMVQKKKKNDPRHNFCFIISNINKHFKTICTCNSK